VNGMHQECHEPAELLTFDTFLLLQSQCAILPALVGLALDSGKLHFLHDLASQLPNFVLCNGSFRRE
jgi:hypothetical protein